ncbi:hypothetical protein SAY86_005339 [Trapa natans]|uniref:pectinesterase n=1 Tax=Trapa natans TaxID=22666 RepID=A0AAN7L0K1_TRANT|nr:hypothetical protein SAY86_005339 [Trapa natans]
MLRSDIGRWLGFHHGAVKKRHRRLERFRLKNCRVTGSAAVMLGPPWDCYARVLFYDSYFTSVVDPRGRDPWLCNGRESQIAFGEYGCYGAGAGRTGRVRWEHEFSESEVHQLTDPSFIDGSISPASQNSPGIFTKVQAAIDSVPENNPSWVVINIKEGTYSEKVIIPQQKSFIVLRGKGHESTEIVWDDHETIVQSPTFTVSSDNIIVEDISFRNCTIVTMGDNLGFITAQSRTDPSESTGFVFKNCRVLGSTTVKLGRPWRCHARVLFYNCYFASVIDREGWDLWLCTGQERQIAFGEYSCYGHGADQTGRVSWEHKFSKSEVQQLTDPSFIGASEWLNQPWWLSLPTS